MDKSFKGGVLKRLSRSASYMAVGVILLMATAQPARAQYTVTIVGGTDYAELILQYLEQLRQETQAAFGQVANVVAQELGTQANAQIADTTNTNNRENVDVATGEAIATDFTPPSYFSYCHIAQGSALADNNGVPSLAQAITQGNQTRTMTQASVYKQDLMCEIKLKFASCDPNDPEGPANIALGCASTPNGANPHVRQDRNVATLIGPMEYPVDPAYQKPLANGTYAPCPAVSADKYYPFIAALTFCQHATPPQPTPPTVTGNGATNAAFATVDVLNIGRYTAAETQISAAPTACYDALERRMQFGDNTPNFPAGSPNPAAGIVTKHDEQVARCVEDNAAGFLDDALLADCRQNGRSELQAEHDMAYRLQSANYQIKFLATLPWRDVVHEISLAKHDELEFKKFVAEERNGLFSAMATSNAVPTVFSGNLSQPIR